MSENRKPEVESAESMENSSKRNELNFKNRIVHSHAFSGIFMNYDSCDISDLEYFFNYVLGMDLTSSFSTMSNDLKEIYNEAIDKALEDRCFDNYFDIDDDTYCSLINIIEKYIFPDVLLSTIMHCKCILFDASPEKKSIRRMREDDESAKGIYKILTEEKYVEFAGMMGYCQDKKRGYICDPYSDLLYSFILNVNNLPFWENKYEFTKAIKIFDSFKKSSENEYIFETLLDLNLLFTMFEFGETYSNDIHNRDFSLYKHITKYYDNKYYRQLLFSFRSLPNMTSRGDMVKEILDAIYLHEEAGENSFAGFLSDTTEAVYNRVDRIVQLTRDLFFLSKQYFLGFLLLEEKDLPGIIQADFSDSRSRIKEIHERILMKLQEYTSSIPNIYKIDWYELFTKQYMNTSRKNHFCDLTCDFYHNFVSNCDRKSDIHEKIDESHNFWAQLIYKVNCPNYSVCGCRWGSQLH